MSNSPPYPETPPLSVDQITHTYTHMRGIAIRIIGAKILLFLQIRKFYRKIRTKKCIF
jgi:hypothetical protein